MTISTTASRISYNGNGATVAFSFPYRFLVNGDVIVVLRSSTGVESTLVLGTHYSLTGAGADAGGTVTMFTAPAVGERLVIYRSVALTQETDYISGDPFPAETHERALDRLTMAAQQLQDSVDRTLRFPVSDTIDPELPTQTGRANRLLGFDADGRPVALTALPDASYVISAFGQSLIDDADAATARATLDVPSRSGANATGTWGIGISGSAANCSRSVLTAGLATGGGALSADRTITVSGSSQAQAEAATDNTTAMTPLRTAQHIAFQQSGSNGGTGTGAWLAGVILQWGSVISGPGINVVNISFPVAFPSVIYSIVVANGDTTANVGESGVQSFSTTGATFQNLRDTNTMRHNWVAIGL